MDKTPGDSVFGGTINETGELELKVTAAANDSTLARIIHAVEQAWSTRAPTQAFIDRFAAVYTPTVFVLALAVAVLTPLLLDWTAAGVVQALVLLVIACPCALVVSTPVTIVSGLATAARRGILIKGGTYLEEARNLKAVALDKTGTITQGKPSLVDWQVWNGADAADVRHIAASLVNTPTIRCPKPLRKAWQTQNQALGTVDGFAALAGQGVQGRIADKSYVLGNHRMIEARGQCSPELEAALAGHEQQGRSLTLLASEQGVMGVFAVADTIKESAREAVAELKALGVTPVMLTGDNVTTAKAVAALAGIIDVRDSLMPEEKLAAIGELQTRYGATGMIGDGINTTRLRWPKPTSVLRWAAQAPTLLSKPPTWSS